MKNRINQLKEIFHDILLVSKLTGTLNKKFIIFAVLITSNLTVLLDIIIILAFTLFLTGEIDTFQIIEAWVGFVKDIFLFFPL